MGTSGKCCVQMPVSLFSSQSCVLSALNKEAAPSPKLTVAGQKPDSTTSRMCNTIRIRWTAAVTAKLGAKYYVRAVVPRQRDLDYLNFGTVRPLIRTLATIAHDVRPGT